MKGFTLIELLVCVAIIGILAAVSFPIFQQYRDKAYFAQLKSITHDLEVVGETLMGDLDLSTASPQYLAYNTFGTFVTVNNDLKTGSQTLEDILPNHIANADKYKISLNVHYIPTTGYYRIYTAAMSCLTSAGSNNVYQVVNFAPNSSSDITVTVTESYSSNHGAGGTHCP